MLRIYNKRNIFIILIIVFSLIFSSCNNGYIKSDLATEISLVDNFNHEEVIAEYGREDYLLDLIEYPKTKKIPRELLPEYDFTDEKSILQMSESDLATIAFQMYYTSDFFQQGDFVFFDFSDNPLLRCGDKPFGDEYEKMLYDEYVFTYLINDKSETIDLDNPYPLQEVKEYIEIDLENTLDAWGGEMDDKAENKSFYLSGEKECYIDYEVRYTLKMYPQVHRRVYFRRLIRSNSDTDSRNKFFYLGDVENIEEIKETFDLYLNGNNDYFIKVIYRDIKKMKKQTVYTAYYIEKQFEPEDENWYGRLFKVNFVVDNENHEVKQYVEFIKQAEIV